MDSCAGRLIPEMVAVSDSIRVLGATLVWVAKLKASGVMSGLQPCSKKTAPNNSAYGGRNDLCNFCTELSWMMCATGRDSSRRPAVGQSRLDEETSSRDEIRFSEDGIRIRVLYLPGTEWLARRAMAGAMSFRGVGSKREHVCAGGSPPLRIECPETSSDELASPADVCHLARVLDLGRHHVHGAGRHAKDLLRRSVAVDGSRLLDDPCAAVCRVDTGRPATRRELSDRETRLGAANFTPRSVQPVLRRRQDRTGSGAVLTPERGLGSGL